MRLVLGEFLQLIEGGMRHIGESTGLANSLGVSRGLLTIQVRFGGAGAIRTVVNTADALYSLDTGAEGSVQLQVSS